MCFRATPEATDKLYKRMKDSPGENFFFKKVYRRKPSKHRYSGYDAAFEYPDGLVEAQRCVERGPNRGRYWPFKANRVGKRTRNDRMMKAGIYACMSPEQARAALSWLKGPVLILRAEADDLIGASEGGNVCFSKVFVVGEIA